MGALNEIIRLESSSTIYKILKSEENTKYIQNVIQNEYINPFGLIEENGKNKLVNFCSGIPIDMADHMLYMFSIGKTLCESFRK